MADSRTDSPHAWPEVTPQPDLPGMEQDVLAHWDRHDVFHASLRKRAGGPVYSFYEGPPTANGTPGTHHVEARVFKDVFPRYRAMKGHDVPRKAGWDCHGLPVELEVEKELGLNSKVDIEDYGIEAFNARCRASVQRYVGEFERLTERIGFWVDMGDAYWTMDPAYVDSLWWALKELWSRDLIFQDFRVAPYCARCGTGLSDAEVAQGYQTVVDPSVYVRFRVTDGELGKVGASLVVWTTTPWTLPSNVAVAINRDLAYELWRAPTGPDGSDELLVIAADLADKLGEDAEKVQDVPVADLLGLHYEAPFTIVDDPVEDYRYVVDADYVTASDGSGLVHTAPAFGADDMETGRRHGLPVLNPVDAQGRFTSGPWKGQFVKTADPAITERLDADGRLLLSQEYEHTYPFCWRCKTPLIYWAKPSWYIRTTAKRQELLENNRKVQWFPEHIRDGRFGNWLENNVDWALSRDRYWGTPLPFWRCGDCDHVTVVGSRAELSERTGRDLSDLDPHRPYVDAVTVPCEACGADATRVPDVADTWFDSGGMPFAQFGYPHRGVEEFERRFPADYICEAIDQTRGWFYTLLAESTLLFDRSSFDTVVCLGHIVDEDGAKMSKSRGNVLDPFDLIDRHGADALRWLMMAEGNPWVNRRVGHHNLEDVVRRFLLTLWNTHVFFLTYARIDGFALHAAPPAVAERPSSDRWVLAELADLVQAVDTALETYDVSRATRRLEAFVDDLSNWYVRRNRRRFWKSAEDDPADKAAAYHTLHTCLRTLAGLLAPFTPFLADRLWQDLVVSQDPDAEVSVHLTDFPEADASWHDDELRSAMATARRVTELGRQARNDSGVKIRQPLARALVTVPAAERDGLARLVDDIADELNVREVQLTDGTVDLVDRAVKPNFRALGPAFQQDAPTVADAIRGLDADEAEELAARLGEAGETTLATGTGEVTLTAEMVEVVETPRTGWAVASDAGSSFALDTELDDDLRLEGAARELVRAVNDLRKQADLALDDRIEVTVDVAEDLGTRLEGVGAFDFLAREVLATTVHRGSVPDGPEVDLAGLGSARVEVHA
jgi:isoleucyl-tRNA synthetase